MNFFSYNLGRRNISLAPS